MIQAKSIVSSANQVGFVLSYILFSIAILAALAGAYASMSRAKTHAELVSASTDRITASFGILRSKIYRCFGVEDPPTAADFLAFQPATNGSYNNQRVIEVRNLICEDGNSILTQGPLLLPPAGFRQWLYLYDSANSIPPTLVIAPQLPNTETAVMQRVSSFFSSNYEGMVLTTGMPNIGVGATVLFLNLQ